MPCRDAMCGVVTCKPRHAGRGVSRRPVLSQYAPLPRFGKGSRGVISQRREKTLKFVSEREIDRWERAICRADIAGLFTTIVLALLSSCGSPEVVRRLSLSGRNVKAIADWIQSKNIYLSTRLHLHGQRRQLGGSEEGYGQEGQEHRLYTRTQYASNQRSIL